MSLRSVTQLGVDELVQVDSGRLGGQSQVRSTWVGVGVVFRYSYLSLTKFGGSKPGQTMCRSNSCTDRLCLQGRMFHIQITSYLYRWWITCVDTRSLQFVEHTKCNLEVLLVYSLRITMVVKYPFPWLRVSPHQLMGSRVSVLIQFELILWVQVDWGLGGGTWWTGTPGGSTVPNSGRVPCIQHDVFIYERHEALPRSLSGQPRLGGPGIYVRL